MGEMLKAIVIGVLYISLYLYIELAALIVNDGAGRRKRPLANMIYPAEPLHKTAKRGRDMTQRNCRYGQNAVSGERL